ncbi:cytochrome P450 [Roseomonas populi]|uniref:Cytochrome P450 n=1 Tax=Roseomonas populi TaxID=3121582 RepID=A0ABT1X9W6_9PROT|nr:cytochrome P450 [Roseomonas pecuniae]MCR0984906.1 cytochrome P450 [Roseomonas pecuniae]
MALDLAELSYPMQRSCPFHPPEAYAPLRENQPFARVRLWDGSHPYLLTRYEDIRAVLAEPRFSCEPVREGFPHVYEGRMVADKADRSFLRLDNPEHDRLRRMVTKEFTVKKVQALRPYIQATVDRLIDNYAAMPQGSDFVEHFAAPLPTDIITLLLGIPYEDHEIFHRATRIQFGSRSTPAEVRESLAELFGYLDALITRKEAEPADDVVSRLVHDQYRPGHIDRITLINIVRLLLSAGHQTTQNMTALGVLTLLQHPDQLALIRADASLIPGAVEELLRFSSILHTGARRVALEDIDVNGHLVRAGEGVICSIPAANRDGELFPDPDRFDVTRDAGPHVAFGFGVHQCLGQVLARAELQIVYETLFRRLPELRLAVPFESLRFRHDMFVYGVHELPLAW